MSNPSNPTEKPKSSPPPRREVWWHDLGAKNQSLESIKRRFEDCLGRFLSSSSSSLLRHIASPMDGRLRHNLHQCPGYLREEIKLVSDVSKSVIISHAFPSQSEVCSICGQLVQYKYTEPSIADVEMQEAPDDQIQNREHTANVKSEQHAQLELPGLLPQRPVHSDPLSVSSAQRYPSPTSFSEGGPPLNSLLFQSSETQRIYPSHNAPADFARSQTTSRSLDEFTQGTSKAAALKGPHRDIMQMKQFLIGALYHDIPFLLPAKVFSPLSRRLPL